MKPKTPAALHHLVVGALNVMRAFVDMRKLALQPFDIAMHLQQIIKRLGEHDIQLNTIFEALEN